MGKFTNIKITGLLCAFTAAASSVAVAQESSPYGRLSGSFETNTIWYMPDSRIYNDTSNKLPDDRIGSNNYLKLDYTLGKFSAGIQGEAYMPVLQGYSSNYNGAKITNKYASWIDDNFSVTVGDFYDQYGSGMIFRSYEDRALGFNNSIEGLRAGYNFKDIFSVSGMMGRPRMFMGYAPTWLRGVDASLSLSSLMGWQNGSLSIEGSYISKYDKQRLEHLNADEESFLSSNLGAWSGRVAYEIAGFSARAEIVGKDPDRETNTDSQNMAKKGSGQLLELGYSGYGWGVSLVGRNIEFMNMTLVEDVPGNSSYQGIWNTMNYLPALTRQYTYSLANLEPLEVNSRGERDLQADIFYSVKKGTAIGGKYGLKLHANVSVAYQVSKYDRVPVDPAKKLEFHKKYFDASLDVEKQWNKKFKTTFLLAYQQIPDRTMSGMYNRYIIVADGTYKFDRRNSLKLELQYLVSPWSKLEEGAMARAAVDSGDWWAVMAEYSFAPAFSVFASDMYNYQTEKIHYYSFGVSYTKSKTRIALSYARNRAGYVCSGGVCRQMPAYTGLNLSLTTSF